MAYREDKVNWRWIIGIIEKLLVDLPYNNLLISDRQKGLAAALQEIFK